jgi:hypothetical protein
VPPLIEGGRGVGLPREIRDNELRVTRLSLSLSLSLSRSLARSLSLFPRFPLALYERQPRGHTDTTSHHCTLSISPPSDEDAVVNHHARHQYHREIATRWSRRGDKDRKREENNKGRKHTRKQSSNRGIPDPRTSPFAL